MEYALAQNSQMICGIDRYFEIAKCFRDELINSVRQPEFTQVDYEMAFCDQNDIMMIAEECLQSSILFVCSKKIQFQSMTYDDAIRRFRTDNLIIILIMSADNENMDRGNPIVDIKSHSQLKKLKCTCMDIQRI
ncbi:hypothetical protein ACOME3_010681, partial [Neoechinorhynchus agilis]